jgi:hypothetical protein
MKFDELYNLVVENEQTVVEEGIFNKLKILALGSLLGYATYNASFEAYKKQIEEELRKNPDKVQKLNNYAIELAKNMEKTLPPEVKREIVKADPVTSLQMIQQAQEEKPFEKQQVVPVQPKKQEDVMSNIKDYIRYHEISDIGIRNNSYADSKGYATIGIGHLILKDEVGPGKLFTPDEISYRTIKGERRRVITISDEKAERIFDKDFNSKVAMATSKYNFPRLLKYPEKLQTAILDGFFRGDISSRQRAGQNEARANIKTAMELFFKYEDALKAGDTVEAGNLLEKGKRFLNIAADNYLKHPDFNDHRNDGVDKRGLKNAEMIRTAFDEYFFKQPLRPETTPNF